MKKADVIIGSVFIVFSVVVLLIIPHQVRSTERMADSSFLPTVVSYGLLGLGVLLIISSIPGLIKQKANEEPQETASEAMPVQEGPAEQAGEEREHIPRIVLVAAIALGYFFLIKYIGYLLATTVALAALLVVFGEKRIWMVTLLSVLGAGITYYIFNNLFYVRLP